MRSIFKVHFVTYILLLSILFCGLFNYFVIIIFILLWHDLGHILTIKLFKYQITKIIFLPFGSMIHSNIKYNIKSSHLFLISIMGVIFQLILYPFMAIAYSLNLITINSLEIFLLYNKIIIIFNLLPIIPLDGSKIIISSLETFISYKLSLKILNGLSIILIFVVGFFFGSSFSLFIVIPYLLFKTLEEIKNHRYTFNQFLLERYMYHIIHRKIKYISKLANIYKNYYNFINNQSEDKILSNYYASKTGNYIDTC